MEAVYSRELGILSNMQNRIDSSVYLNIRGTPAIFFFARFGYTIFMVHLFFKSQFYNIFFISNNIVIYIFFM